VGRLCLEGLMKTLRIACDPVEIRTEHLSRIWVWSVPILGISCSLILRIALHYLCRFALLVWYFETCFALSHI
jgi:hypothetical protein